MFNLADPLVYVLGYMLVLYLRPHEFIPGVIGLPLQPVLLVLAFATWLGRKGKGFDAPQFRLLPFFMLLMSWSVLLTSGVSAGVNVIAQFAPVVMLFMMLATSIDTVARLRSIFRLVSIMMVIVAVHCIDQHAKGVGWTGAEPIGDRVTYIGFLADPNDLSMAFLMALPMMLYLARHANKFWSLVWYVGIVVMMDGLRLCNSRGSVLALGVMMLHYGIFRYGLVKSLMVVPLMILPIILFGPSRMNEMNAEEESAQGRVEAWIAGFDMLRQHPLFGVGTWQFTDHNSLTAHNSYVLALAEQGLVGYFFWLSIIVLTWLMATTVQKAGLAVPAPSGPVQPASAMPAPQVFGRLMRPPGQRPGLGAPSTENWAEVHEASRTLWYGFTGALVCMYFLSRSYVPFLFVHIALIVAMYQLARRLRPDIPALHFADRWGRLLGFALLTALGLRVVTKLLS
jgi:hypothetical protein